MVGKTKVWARSMYSRYRFGPAAKRLAACAGSNSLLRAQSHLRMKQLIFAFVLLPLVVRAEVGHSSSRSSDCERISVVRARVPLPSNTPIILYQEFQSSFEVLTQLLIDRQHEI